MSLFSPQPAQRRRDAELRSELDAMKEQIDRLARSVAVLERNAAPAPGIGRREKHLVAAISRLPGPAA